MDANASFPARLWRLRWPRRMRWLGVKRIALRLEKGLITCWPVCSLRQRFIVVLANDRIPCTVQLGVTANWLERFGECTPSRLRPIMTWSPLHTGQLQEFSVVCATG
jgi:hypothetical protein